MAVEIIHNRFNAVMTCTTTDTAFGPVAYEVGDLEAEEVLEKFIKHLPLDPRSYGESELLTRWSRFLTELEENEPEDDDE